MDKQLLVNLKLNTDKAQQDLNKFKSEQGSIELFDEAKAVKAIEGIANKLGALKDTLVINAELDAENVTKQLETVKKKLAEETGEEFKLKVSADLDIDAEAIKSAIADAFDTSGSMANFNVLQKGIDDLKASLGDLGGIIEIDTDSIDDATDKIDALQEKLKGLSTNIGLDLNVPNNNNQQNQQPSFAATPKNSEQVRQVEQDAVSTPRTELSKNYLENVTKDTRKASNQAGRAGADKLEGYLKELVAHQKNLAASGHTVDMAKMITKLDDALTKVSKSFKKKGGDPDAIIAEAQSVEIKVDPNAVLDSLTPFAGLGKQRRQVSGKEKFQHDHKAFGDGERSPALDKLASNINHFIKQLSNLDPTTPIVKRNANFSTNSNGQYRPADGSVNLSPQVVKSILPGAEGKPVSLSDLTTLVHEIRHSQQINQKNLRKDQLILQPQNAKEQGIVDHVRSAYSDRSDREQTLEIDAHLFAERFTKQIANLSGILTFDESTVANLKDSVGTSIATLTETLDKLTDTSGLTDQQVEAYKVTVVGAAKRLNQLQGQIYESLDGFDSDNPRHNGVRVGLSGIAETIPDFPENPTFTDVASNRNVPLLADFAGGAYSSDAFQQESAAITGQEDTFKELSRQAAAAGQSLNDLGGRDFGFLDDLESGDFEGSGQGGQPPRPPAPPTPPEPDSNFVPPSGSVDDSVISALTSSLSGETDSFEISQAIEKLTNELQNERTIVATIEARTEDREPGAALRTQRATPPLLPRPNVDHARHIRHDEMPDNREIADITNQRSAQERQEVRNGEDIEGVKPFAISDFTSKFDELDGVVGEVFDGVAALFETMKEFTIPTALATLSSLFVKMVLDSLDTVVAFQQLELTLNNLKLGNADEAAESVRFMATEMGVGLASTAEALSKFTAATKGTALTSAANDIFESVTRYGQSIGAGDDEMERAFVALEQMAAKGKVSLEELNGQLAEALPGASNIAAEALGVSRKEMFRMAEGGNLLATDLIPKMAAAMESISFQGAATSTKTLSQEWGKLTNQFELARVEGLAHFKVMEMMSDAIKYFNGVIERNPGLMEIVSASIIALVAAIGVLTVVMIKSTVIAAGWGATMAASAAAAAPIIAAIAAVTAALVMLIKLTNDDPLKSIFGTDGVAWKDTMDKYDKLHIAHLKMMDDLQKEEDKRNGKKNEPKPGDTPNLTADEKEAAEKRYDGVTGFFNRSFDRFRADASAGIDKHKQDVADYRAKKGLGGEKAPTSVAGTLGQNFVNNVETAGIGIIAALKGTGQNIKNATVVGAADADKKKLLKGVNKKKGEDRDNAFESSQKANNKLLSDFTSTKFLEDYKEAIKKRTEAEQEVAKVTNMRTATEEVRADLPANTSDAEALKILADRLIQGGDKEYVDELLANSKSFSDAESFNDKKLGEAGQEARDTAAVKVLQAATSINTNIDLVKKDIDNLKKAEVPDEEKIATNQKTLTELQLAREALFKIEGSSKALVANSIAQLEEIKALDLIQSEGRDVLQTQSNTASKQQAIQEGNFNADALDKTQKLNRIDQIEVELPMAADDRDAHLTRMVETIKRDQLATFAYLIDGLTVEEIGGTGGGEDRTPEEIKAALSNLTIPELDKIIANPEGSNLKDDTLAFAKGLRDLTLEGTQATADLQAEKADITYDLAAGKQADDQDALKLQEDAEDFARRSAKEDRDYKKRELVRVKALGDAERAHTKRMNEFAKRQRNTQKNLQKAANGLSDTFADMVKSLDTEITNIIGEIKGLEIDAKFKALKNSTNEQLIGVELDDLSAAALETVNKYADATKKELTDATQFEIEKAGIESAFEDGVDAIQGAFDDYLEAFRGFQQDLKDLAESIKLEKEGIQAKREKSDEDKKDSNENYQDILISRQKEQRNLNQRQLEFDKSDALFRNGGNVYDTEDFSQASIKNFKGEGTLSPQNAEFSKRFSGKKGEDLLAKTDKVGEASFKADQAVIGEVEKTNQETKAVKAEAVSVKLGVFKHAMLTQEGNSFLDKIATSVDKPVSIDFPEDYGTDNDLLFEIVQGVISIHDLLSTGGLVSSNSVKEEVGDKESLLALLDIAMQSQVESNTASPTIDDKPKLTAYDRGDYTQLKPGERKLNSDYGHIVHEPHTFQQKTMAQYKNSNETLEANRINFEREIEKVKGADWLRLTAKDEEEVRQVAIDFQLDYASPDGFNRTSPDPMKYEAGIDQHGDQKHTEALEKLAGIVEFAEITPQDTQLEANRINMEREIDKYMGANWLKFTAKDEEEVRQTTIKYDIPYARPDGFNRASDDPMKNKAGTDQNRNQNEYASRGSSEVDQTQLPANTESLEKVVVSNEAVNKQSAVLSHNIAELSSKGITHNVAMPDLSNTGFLSKLQDILENTEPKGRDRSGDIIDLADREPFRHKTMEEYKNSDETKEANRIRMEMDIAKYMGSDWMKHTAKDEEEVRQTAIKYRIDYASPNGFQRTSQDPMKHKPGVDQHQDKYTALSGGSSSSEKQADDRIEITAAQAKTYEQYGIDMDKYRVMADAAQVGKAEDYPSIDFSSETYSVDGLDVAKVEVVNPKEVAKENSALAAVNPRADEAKQKLGTKKNLEEKALDLRKDISNEDIKSIKIDGDNGFAQALRKNNERQAELTKDLTKQRNIDLNDDPVEGEVARNLYSESATLRGLTEQLAELNKGIASVQNGVGLAAKQAREQGDEELAKQLEADAALVVGKMSKNRDLVQGNANIAKQQLEDRTSGFRSFLESDHANKKQYGDRADFLKAKLGRKGSSGAFANKQQLELFDAEQKLGRASRIKQMADELQKLENISEQDAIGKVTEKVEALEKIELSNFKDNMNTIVNFGKETGKGLFKDLLSVNLIDGDGIGQQLIGIARNVLSQLQDWAATYVTDSLFDLLFNKDRSESGDEAENSLLEQVDSTLATKQEGDKKMTDGIMESETEQKDTLDAHRKDLFSTSNIAQYGAGAAALGAGVATGNGAAVGGGIGTILGTIAGTFLGNSQLGGMAGGALGSALGGLFAEGTDSVDGNSVLDMSIAEAMRVEKQRSGRTAQLAVLHEGESVLSTLNGDADTFRRLKAMGTWDMLKNNSYAMGADYISQTRSSIPYGNFQSTYDNSKSNSSSVVNNFNISATDGDVVKRTSTAMAQRRSRLGL